MKKKWNRASIFGIILLILSIYGFQIFPLFFTMLIPVAVFCGIVALVEIKKTGERGKILAIITLIWGGLLILSFFQGFAKGYRGE